jgi:hypothetical protein
MRRSYTLSTRVEVIDRPDRRYVHIELDGSSAVDLALELSLLLYDLAEALTIRGSNRPFALKIQKLAGGEGSARIKRGKQHFEIPDTGHVVWTADGPELHLVQNDLENWLGFLLQGYRDGMFPGYHEDLEYTGHGSTLKLTLRAAELPAGPARKP